MASNGILFINQNYVQTGLGTLTFTVPTTVSALNIATVNMPFTVQCQVTAPSAVATGAGSGSGADQGLGMLGGTQGIGQGTGLGNGGKGLGFGAGTTQTTYNTSGNGHGAGAGGGTLGEFSLGGGGLADGSVGQGFGTPTSGYPQPLADVHTPNSGAAVSSSLTIVVNKNGSPVYTAPAFTPTQEALQFKTPGIVCSAADTITVVLSSSNANDAVLQAIKANISVQLGE